MNRPALALSLSFAGVGLALAGDDAASKVDFHTDRGTPEKLALLVGIADYPEVTNREWADLEGSVNDTTRVRGLLVDSFGFHPDDVKVLVDSQATHENIVRGFREWLIGRAGPDTEVVFWFSGHGSRVPDRSGASNAELDGLDSTFLAWDSRLNGYDGEFDLTDDELHSLVKVLTERTSRVTIVTDSCYSGGTMRGGSPLKARSARPGSRGRDRALSFWPEDVPYLDDDADQSADPGRYVHISACSSREPALEWRLSEQEGGTAYGALTFFLAYAMENSEPSDSYRLLADRVRAWLGYNGLTQAVTCEGAADRALFEGRFQPRPPGFAVLDWPTRRSVRIQAGSLIGIQRGTGFRLVGLDGTEHATATVVRVSPAECEARVAEGQTPPQGYLVRAILSTKPWERAPLPIQVASDLPELEIPGADIVRGDDSSLHSLRVEERGGERRVRLYTPTGVVVWRSAPLVGAPDPAALAADLAKAVENEQKYREVNALLSEPGTLRLTGHFRPVTDAELEGPGGGRRWAARATRSHVRLAQPLHDGFADGSYLAEIPPPKEGEMALATLEVHNPNPEPVYLAVLSVTEDRAVTLVHPVASESVPALEPGATRTLHLALSVNDALGLDRPMRDRYLLIATESPADFQSMTQKTVLRGADGVPPLVRRAYGADGAGDVSTEVDGFGVSAVDLFVAIDDG